MTRHLVTPPTLDAIHSAVVLSMESGDGRVSAETLARILAENEPERVREERQEEMPDSEFEALFAARFGHGVYDVPPRTVEDSYQLDFERRFGYVPPEASS